MATKRKNALTAAAAVSVAATLCVSFTACTDNTENGGGTKDASYTLNQYVSTSPEKWNPHAWENDSDRLPLSYVSMGFYDAGFNANKDGYEWIPEMASALPEDVTSSYVGKYGVVSGDKNKAFKIKLNENATWDDGTKITADDYIYSMQQQLAPEMINRRADSYTGGTTAIYGAASYFRQNSPIYKAFITDGEDEEYVSEISTDENGNVTVSRGGETLSLFTSFSTTATPFFGTQTMKYYHDANPAYFYAPYTGDTSDPDELPAYVVSEDDEGGKVYYEDLYEKWVAKEDVRGWVALTEELVDDLKIIAQNCGDNNPVAWNEFAFYYDGINASYEWDDVGLLKTGEYELTIIYLNSVSDFHVKYSLTSNWLVKEDLYESCKITTSGSEIVSSRYGTSLDTTASYGPYKLSQFSDNYFEFVKNDKWYGYTDGAHEGQFQTTKVTFRRITGSTAHDTAKQMFMTGQLDSINILGSEMGDYGGSQYLLQTPESYTMQFFMNTDFNSLQKEDTATENHSVLSLTNFRKALSYSMDRQQYCSAYSPASVPGYGLLNYMYVYDPDTGSIYRESEEAKRTILAFEGFTENADGTWKYGTGDNAATYSTLDEAYEAITNYDIDYAAELLHEAYKEAVQKGIITTVKDVVIDYGYPNTTPTDNANAALQMFNTQIKAAVDKSKELYGDETFNSVTYRYKTFADENLFWAALENNELDLAFSGWGGSAFDVWGTVFSCYIDQNNVMVPGFDKTAKATDITIEVNGRNVTASLYDWASWLNNGQKADDFDKTNLAATLGVLVGDAETSFKLKVLAACELAQLQTYSNFPVLYQYENELQSAKVTNGSDEYIQLVGFGGIRYLTFNYTDEEWSKFVTDNSVGGTLENYYKTH